uniref:Uncharacterized protein n=1 Tax=Varanus komodoensis TaxID=61221 RepID=A0A8D2ILE9_VARKO
MFQGCLPQDGIIQMCSLRGTIFPTQHKHWFCEPPTGVGLLDIFDCPCPSGGACTCMCKLCKKSRHACRAVGCTKCAQGSVCKGPLPANAAAISALLWEICGCCSVWGCRDARLLLGEGRMLVGGCY